MSAIFPRGPRINWTEIFVILSILAIFWGTLYPVFWTYRERGRIAAGQVEPPAPFVIYDQYDQGETESR